MFDPYEYKGCTITISPDEFAESPRYDDNLGTMICCHGRYDLGDRSIQPNEVDAVFFAEGGRGNLADHGQVCQKNFANFPGSFSEAG